MGSVHWVELKAIKLNEIWVPFLVCIELNYCEIRYVTHPWIFPEVRFSEPPNWFSLPRPRNEQWTGTLCETYWLSFYSCIWFIIVTIQSVDRNWTRSRNDTSKLKAAVNMGIINSHNHIICNYTHRMHAVSVHLQIHSQIVHVYVSGMWLLQVVVSPDPPSWLRS